jgi:cytochrome c oxidase cbb3-type subunit 4
MDPGLLRSIGDLVLFVAFVALCVWAYSPAQRARFEEDGLLPFREDADDVTAERGAR